MYDVINKHKLASGNTRESLKFCRLILLILSELIFFNILVARDFSELSLGIAHFKKDPLSVEQVKFSFASTFFLIIAMLLCVFGTSSESLSLPAT